SRYCFSMRPWRRAGSSKDQRLLALAEEANAAAAAAASAAAAAALAASDSALAASTATADLSSSVAALRNEVRVVLVGSEDEHRGRRVVGLWGFCIFFAAVAITLATLALKAFNS